MTIRAVGATRFGGPEVLQEVDLPDPNTGPGQVRVRVHASGVNPVDAMMRTGLLAGMYDGVEPPYVPGMEVAGTVEEAGDDVDAELAPGRFLPELIDLIWRREIDPGKVFDLELPLDQAAEAYQAMDERRAIKVLLRP